MGRTGIYVACAHSGINGLRPLGVSAGSGRKTVQDTYCLRCIPPPACLAPCPVCVSHYSLPFFVEFSWDFISYIWS